MSVVTTSSRTRKTPVFSKAQSNIELVKIRLTAENLDKAFPEEDDKTPERNHRKVAVENTDSMDDAGYSSHASDTSQNGAVKRYLAFDLPEGAKEMS